MCKGLAALPATCLKSAKDIKHKISFLLQKPEPQVADQKQMKEKSATAAAATAAAAAAAVRRVPTANEVKKWKESFSHVMISDTGRMVFTSFLRSEFSEENMDFWLACEGYKKTSPCDLASAAKQLYQQYVEADAPKQVNLDAATREETRQKVENPCPRSFDDAQKMIYALMEKDSYKRFLKSKIFHDLPQDQTKNYGRVDGRQASAGGA